jgi:hypothetical protein
MVVMYVCILSDADRARLLADKMRIHSDGCVEDKKEREKFQVDNAVEEI